MLNSPFLQQQAAAGRPVGAGQRGELLREALEAQVHGEPRRVLLRELLLHLGPGLANGVANLHNARKAASGIVNIVGEHATYHVKHDAPLTSDIEGIARPVSAWVRTSSSARTVAPDGAAAILAARTAPGQVARSMPIGAAQRSTVKA